MPDSFLPDHLRKGAQCTGLRWQFGLLGVEQMMNDGLMPVALGRVTYGFQCPYL